MNDVYTHMLSQSLQWAPLTLGSAQSAIVHVPHACLCLKTLQIKCLNLNVVVLKVKLYLYISLFLKYI